VRKGYPGLEIPTLPASSGAIVQFKDKILLIKRDNNPKITNPNKWGIPGGQTEKGENLNQTLERELQEEINFTPHHYLFLGFLGYQKDKIKRAIYLVKVTKKDFPKIKLGNEGQELGWFKPKEIGQIEAVPEIKVFFKKHAEEIEKLLQGKKNIKTVKNELEKIDISATRAIKFHNQ